MRMLQVFKYGLPMRGPVVIEIPGGGRQVLGVLMQHDALQLYVLVDDRATPMSRAIAVVFTGEPFDLTPGDGRKGVHVGSFQTAAGLVGHVFDFGVIE